MSKEAYYFSHDSNARHDPKITAMRGVYGSVGYAWFFMFIEMMRETDGFKLDMQSKYAFNAYAMQMQCETDAIASFVHDCVHEFYLFSSDGVTFWSESLLRRMDKAHEKSQKAKDSANVRWKKKHENANASNSNANASKNDALKESKVNKKESSATTDDYDKVRTAYIEIHRVMDMPLQDSPTLSKMLQDGIPPDLIIVTMKDKFKLGVKTIKYYTEAINERFNHSKQKQEKVDPQIATRHREIAFNRFMDKGGKPDEFIYNAPTGT